MTHPDSFRSRSTLTVDGESTSLTVSTHCGRGPVPHAEAARRRSWSGSPSASRSCSRICCEMKTGSSRVEIRHRDARRAGMSRSRRSARSPFARAACCCRTSPACRDRRSGRHARRDAALGGDPKRINPLQPVDLVIDHSVQVDEFGTPAPSRTTRELEFERNQRALRISALGADGVPAISASCRRTPASCTR